MPGAGFHQAAAHKARTNQKSILAARATANLVEYSRAGTGTGLESETVLVSDRRRRPDG